MPANAMNLFDASPYSRTLMWIEFGRRGVPVRVGRLYLVFSSLQTFEASNRCHPEGRRGERPGGGGGRGKSECVLESHIDIRLFHVGNVAVDVLLL